VRAGGVIITEETTITVDAGLGSARLEDVTEQPPPTPDEPAELDQAQREAIAQMVRHAKDAGIALTGPNGLLKALTGKSSKPPWRGSSAESWHNTERLQLPPRHAPPAEYENAFYAVKASREL